MRCCPSCLVEGTEKECWVCGAPMKIGTLFFWTRQTMSDATGFRYFPPK